LETEGIADARQLVQRLKFQDFTSEGETQPGTRHYYRGRSFYSEAALRDLEKSTAEAADKAEAAETIETTTADVADEEEAAPKRSEYRQEEARLVTYVREALDEIYVSEHGPEVATVFDVHRDRPGSEFENVDLIAVHWRADDVVELITVEVKLYFNARLVQQANNYRRFSDRVWIAVPVDVMLPRAATQLREIDPLLFEHAVESGLGILACWRRRGRSYEIAPIHWPRLLRPDRVERTTFLDRHRAVFEEARVIAPREREKFPKFTS
jgi:ketosteroid isomerase-like protein